MIHHSDSWGMTRPIRCECGRVHHISPEFALGNVAVNCICGALLACVFRKQEGELYGEMEVQYRPPEEIAKVVWRNWQERDDWQN